MSRSRFRAFSLTIDQDVVKELGVFAGDTLPTAPAQPPHGGRRALVAGRHRIYAYRDAISSQHAVEGPQRSSRVIRRGDDQEAAKVLCARVDLGRERLVIRAADAPRESYNVFGGNAGPEKDIPAALDRAGVALQHSRPSTRQSIVGEENRSSATLMEEAGPVPKAFRIHR